ncbi:MAG: DUF1003 domain-containing protein [Rhodospirillales bacterium]|nr:DUF1003 domain-containing protein [Alphaproteobacteria bacterium]MCB9986060.1 DUF1003 domain-containing protein [Rhodospirillales bacterium]USO07371.1 MAG: DUF1003 domain-containing protein [Rhodospirillales bacterium]
MTDAQATEQPAPETQNHDYFTSEDRKILRVLRHKDPAKRHVPRSGHTLGERVSDVVAATVGSWRFIIIQSVLLVFWLILNVTGWMKAWDPYPFILLNLMLSFQAAYTAPIIMMSQNRQADIDRRKAEKDYDVNLKAELEIELLHQKIDLMREQEIMKLTQMIEALTARLESAKGA